MKKYFVSLAIPLAVLSLAIVFSVPTTSQAQVACPAGYTCTPIAPVTNCPIGYTCTPVASVTNACYMFVRNLGVGSYGNDVQQLTSILTNQGFLNGAKNQYDENVAAAVTSFQEKYASDILVPNGLSNGTGYVGKATRTKLNSCNFSNIPVTISQPSPMPSVPANPPTITPSGLQKDNSPHVSLSINNNSMSTMVVPENTILTLSWNAVNSSYCNTSGGFSNWAATSRPTSGSVELKNTAQVSTVFTITCYDNKGQAGLNSIRVNVTESPAPIINFSANNVSDTLVIKEGTSVTFSWDSNGAAYCRTFGGSSSWPASYRPTSGSIELRDHIQVSQTYSLSCTNSANESSTKSIRINVQEATSTP